MRPGRPGCSRDQDERGQEEAHPGEGGVGRIFDIIVQATPRAATPAADSPEKRRRESPSPIRRVREKEARDLSSRSTSAASSDARLQQDVSVPSRRDKEDVSSKEKSKRTSL